jgi:hypothetical protein
MLPEQELDIKFQCIRNKCVKSEGIFCILRQQINDLNNMLFILRPQ